MPSARGLCAGLRGKVERLQGERFRVSRSSCFERIWSTGGLGRWWNSARESSVYVSLFSSCAEPIRIALQFHRNQKRARRKWSLLVCKTLVEKGRCTSGSDQASTIDFRPSQNFHSFLLPLTSPLSFPSSALDINCESIGPIL